MFDKVILETEFVKVTEVLYRRYRVRCKQYKETRRSSCAEARRLKLILSKLNSAGFDVSPGAQRYEEVLEEFASAILGKGNLDTRYFFAPDADDVAQSFAERFTRDSIEETDPKRALELLVAEMPALRVDTLFPDIHHFSSGKFDRRPSNLAQFADYCHKVGRLSEGENVQTIRRALDCMRRIKRGEAEDQALEYAWHWYPLLTR